MEDPKIKSVLDRIEDKEQRDNIWKMTEDIVKENLVNAQKEYPDMRDFYIRIIESLISMPQDHWFMNQ